MMKKAVVFVLDASPSMNTPYPAASENNTKGTTTQTRLSCAKQAIIDWTLELMLESKSHEVGVVVCNTDETKIVTDFAEYEFRNITELGVLQKPTVDLLRAVDKIETTQEEDISDYEGYYINGIMLATRAIRARTKTLKYERSIVVLTDTEFDRGLTKEQVDMMLQTIDDLQESDIALQVIGMDFSSSGDFTKCEEDESEGEEEGMEVDQDGSSTRGSDTGDQSDKSMEEEEDSEDDDDNDNEEAKAERKRLREAFIVDIAKKTNGTVVAASTLEQLLEATKGKKIKNSSLQSIDLVVAPGLEVKAKIAILMQKTSVPSIKERVVKFDRTTKQLEPKVSAPTRIDESEAKPSEQETQGVVQDLSGEEETYEVATRTEHWIGRRNLEAHELAKAIEYGSELIPMNAFDYEGCRLAERSSTKRIEILEYVAAERIPHVYLNDKSPRILVGDPDSVRACTLIASLAQGLFLKKKVAICKRHTGSKKGEPVLGALLPIEGPENEAAQLVYMEIPYTEDVKSLLLEPLDNFVHGQNSEALSRASDALVDAFMLPDGALESGSVASPFSRSWYQTMTQRALNDKAEPVCWRFRSDQMSTPQSVLENGRGALDSFYGAAGLVGTMKVEKKKGDKKAKARGNKRLMTYKDFL